MLINKSDLPDTEYVAVYASRSDGEWVVDASPLFIFC